MHDNKSLISVIIPTYNRETYLSQAIESVLAQTYQPLDIIIIDDGSSDSSDKIVQSYVPQVRYYYQPNAGIGSALKKGIELADGQYFAFLDSDDLWVSDKLSRQMTFLTENPGVDAVFSQIEQFYSSDILPELRQKYRYARKILSAYCADTILIKRKAFFQAGNFNPDHRSGAFIDWYTRAQDQKLNFELLPIVLAKRRIHNTNYGIRNRSVQHAEYTRILKSVLDRRRADKSKVSEN